MKVSISIDHKDNSPELAGEPNCTLTWTGLTPGQIMRINDALMREARRETYDFSQMAFQLSLKLETEIAKHEEFSAHTGSMSVH